MTELSAIEAKEAAVREVAKLLPLPENLASIAALKADFAQRQQANDAQLSTSVMTQVEQAKAGMDVLAASQATIGELRDAFMLIDKLCTECKNLIDHHDQINLLSHARNNLNTAIKDAEGMMSISEEAAAARASLANEKELVRTFERLNVLEGKRRFALAATGSRKAEASRLTEYFEEVSQTREMFEQTLWGHIRDFFNLAQESPQTLVRCAKIVEMQEAIDTEAAREAAEAEKASAGGGDPPGTTAPPKQPRSYKTRCFSELERGVEDHFHDLLNNFIHEDLKKVLDEASAIASELPDIYDYVAPCFPPQYEIFVFMVQLYTQHFSAMLRKLGDRGQDLANIDILKVMGWIARYQEQLLALGVEESKAEILAECGAMDPLMNAYVDRMQDSMQSWFRNILEDDWSREPKFSEEGRAWTPSAVDFFRLLGEQVATVQNNCTGVMVYKVAQAVIQVMNDFQAAERTHMELPVMEIGLEHLCALVNNNVRCYDLAKDLSENIMHSLPDYYAEQIHFEDTCRNFLDIAKDAVHLTLKLIFEDPGVKSILQALYQNDWYQGLVTETLIETFRDYFGDIEKFIEERSFRRFAEACLERTIVAYVDALLLQKNYVKEATLERMGKDEYQINDFFKAYVNEKKVEKRVQPLADLRELIMSDSPESFELNYTTLLQNHPDCPPEVVAKLVGFREDIVKADKKEVIARCQEIFQGTLKDGEGPKPGLIFSHLTAIPRPKLTLKK